jgi:flagellar P-ring protein precursor FlgI
LVTATLPPFAQPGTRIDVTVAAIGDATSLRGGLLVMTSLRGIDGQVYSVAQGPVVTGGFVVGAIGTSQTVNHPTVGRIPEGATIERLAPSAAPTNQVRLQLHNEDFTTAVRIAEAVNHHFSASPSIAHADNSALVSIAIPAGFSSRTAEFVAELESLSVEADRPAKVVINERTGTIVMGKEVRVSPVAIMHGNLTVEIQTIFNVSQPNPLSTGTTEVVPQVNVSAKEQKARNVVLKEGATVEELVRALSSIGSTARDIIAILQALRSAGALESEIEVI